MRGHGRRVPRFGPALADLWDSGLPPAYPIPVPDRVTPTYEWDSYLGAGTVAGGRRRSSSFRIGSLNINFSQPNHRKSYSTQYNSPIGSGMNVRRRKLLGGADPAILGATASAGPPARAAAAPRC